MSQNCSAVIVAAGNSTRMGIPKQLVAFYGEPALSYTLKAFDQAESVSEIIVVARPDEQEKILLLAGQACKSKKVCCVTGGESRQQSVLAGVRAASETAEIVAVHDGARLLITADEINRVIADAVQHGASALAVRVKDTIKTVGEGCMVAGTPVRASLWAVQTPQVFPRAAFLCALECAVKEGREYTDDCQLWEQRGNPVHLLLGNDENIKLTTPTDLLVAQAILQKRLKKREAAMMRIGNGYDVHRLAEKRRLILGGVCIPYEKGLLGHSDADVLAHAIADALLGAASMGDIGKLFPDTDAQWKDADSMKLLAVVAGRLAEKDYSIVNIDSTVLAQAPKLAPYIIQMRENIAHACGISPIQVSVKATTEEGLGFTGLGQGIAAHAVCLLQEN